MPTKDSKAPEQGATADVQAEAQAARPPALGMLRQRQPGHAAYQDRRRREPAAEAVQGGPAPADGAAQL